MFNSAVVPAGGGVAGVFRADHRNARPALHTGRSAGVLRWALDSPVVPWQDGAGRAGPNRCAHDPRLVAINGTRYVTGCDDSPEPWIPLGRLQALRTSVRIERPLMPHIRNGVLFPRRIGDGYALIRRTSDAGDTQFGDLVVSYRPDLTDRGGHRLVMRRRPGTWWESTKIGAGPVPIEASAGWPVVDHGVITGGNGFGDRVGSALLDCEDAGPVPVAPMAIASPPRCPIRPAGSCATVCSPAQP